MEGLPRRAGRAGAARRGVRGQRRPLRDKEGRPRRPSGGGVAAVLRPFPPQRARPSSPQGGSRLSGGAPLALRPSERGRGPAGPRRLACQMAVEVPEALRLGGGEHRGDVHLLQAARLPSQASEVHQHA